MDVVPSGPFFALGKPFLTSDRRRRRLLRLRLPLRRQPPRRLRRNRRGPPLPRIHRHRCTRRFHW